MGRRLGIGIVGALVIVLVGGRAWVRSRDYLAEGSTARTPADARVIVREFPDPDEPEDLAIVRYRDGGRSSYGLSVANEGPLTVKVTEIARPETRDESLNLFRVTGVRMNRRRQTGTAADLPFRPFELVPGEERYVEVDGIMDRCEENSVGAGVGLSSQTVRFEVFGQSLEKEIPLPYEVQWRYSRRSQCG